MVNPPSLCLDSGCDPPHDLFSPSPFLFRSLSLSLTLSSPTLSIFCRFIFRWPLFSSSSIARVYTHTHTFNNDSKRFLRWFILERTVIRDTSVPTSDARVVIESRIVETIPSCFFSPLPFQRPAGRSTSLFPPLINLHRIYKSNVESSIDLFKKKEGEKEKEKEKEKKKGNKKTYDPLISLVRSNPRTRLVGTYSGADTTPML